ncbi:MAG TPA: TRAP transporter small permease subunit [Caldimonas sp.]|nr:TRAP transporter small permease subunit [Caldimonas sp.]HEX2542083.1 TRAP transporter small permease subunit [Caldimonas sp.]
MTSAGEPGGDRAAGSTPPDPTRAPVTRGPIGRFCAAVDALNHWVGLFWGFTIVLVTLAVLYEVFARTVFGSPTQWANETTIYLSAMAYLLAGGYALLHRRHVRIDVIYDRLSPQVRGRLDAFTFLFFAAYVLTLIWTGGTEAWNSFQFSETTSTPWNPPIWPVKMAIPLAGVLLLLQGFANLARDLGWTRGELPA